MFIALRLHNKDPKWQWLKPDTLFSPAFTVYVVELCRSLRSSKDSGSFHRGAYSSASWLSWLLSCVPIPAHGMWKDPKPRASDLPYFSMTRKLSFALTWWVACPPLAARKSDQYDLDLNIHWPNKQTVVCPFSSRKTTILPVEFV